MCVLDYDFMILDNAFLIHRPGIKTASAVTSNSNTVKEQQKFITKHVLPELKQLYGVRQGCHALNLWSSKLVLDRRTSKSSNYSISHRRKYVVLFL